MPVSALRGGNVKYLVAKADSVFSAHSFVRRKMRGSHIQKENMLP
jgi:hypothetical protein